MTADRRLEQRIADFYAAELPSQAPDRVLAEALATIEHTHQRRALKGVPWRFSYMSSFAKLAAAAVAVVAVVAIGWALYANNQGIGTQPTATPAITPEPSPSPTPTPSPQPTATPADHALSQTYTSALHGMSVGYPAGWMFVASSVPWTSGLPGTDADSRDTIMSNEVDNLFIGLASQPLAGRSGDEWIAEILAHPEQGAPCPATDTEPVTVDGASGILTVCQDRPLEALVTDGERGYFVVFYGSDDRAWFEDILATVRLDPSAAIEPSASPSDGTLTQTFTSALHGMSVDYPAGWSVAPGSGPWTTALPGTDTSAVARHAGDRRRGESCSSA